MKVVGLLLRVFSYFFFLLTSLLLLGIALLATVNYQPLNLPMLPLDPNHSLLELYAIAVAGLVVVVLAWRRRLRILYPFWAGATLYSLVTGYFFSPYMFRGAEDFRAALWLVGAAFLAFVGALWTLKPRRGRLYS